MKEHKLGFGIFLIVGAIALVSLLLMEQGLTGLMGSPVYEQPSNNKPVFLQQSTFIADFDLCKQYYCGVSGVKTYAGAGEYEPAQLIGTDALTGNLRCACPDGKVFQARPDRIEVNNY